MRFILAQPRGFCAGVVRAIDIVEKALDKYGEPVYVRHEIVHNKHVVDKLKNKGARFVEELDEVPEGAVTVFSAHGVPQSVGKTPPPPGLDPRLRPPRGPQYKPEKPTPQLPSPHHIP